MKAKTREPMEALFDWPVLLEYPGIYAIESDGDKRLCEARIEIEEAEAGGRYKTEYDSRLVDFGLVPKHLDNLETMTVPFELLASTPWTKAMDFRTCLLIDWRLRWCRCFLDHADYPYDREPLVLLTRDDFWHYESEDWPESGGHTPTDTIDYTLQLVHLTYSPQWFAAKLLSHFRRARTLEVGQSNDLCLAREWMLFGETWAEAKFIFNQEANAIRGAKIGRAGAKGGDARRHVLAPDTDLKLKEMARLIDAGHTVKGAAEALARRGISKAHAIRQLWNRSPRRKEL